MGHVRALDEDGRIAETLAEHLAADVVESGAFADRLSCLGDLRVSVDVGDLAEAETLLVGGRREAIDDEGRLRSVEGLANALVELIVRQRTPEGLLSVFDGDEF